MKSHAASTALDASLHQSQGDDLLPGCRDRCTGLSPEHDLLVGFTLDPAEEARAVLQDQLVYLELAAWHGHLACRGRLRLGRQRKNESQDRENNEVSEVPGSHLLHKAHSSGPEAQES